MSPESLPKGDHYEYGHRLDLGTQNGHLEELVNNARAVGDSSLKCRVGAIADIAQSPSHSLSHPLKGMASQQLQLAVAGSQCELP